MQWFQDNIVALFKGYGPWTAVAVIVILVLLALLVVWALGIDVGEFIGSVNWNGVGRGRA